MTRRRFPSPDWQARIAVLSAAARAHPLLFGLIAVSVVAGPALAVAFTVASGAVVGATIDARDAGALAAAVSAMAGLFVLQQFLAPLQGAALQRVYRSVNVA